MKAFRRVLFSCSLLLGGLLALGSTFAADLAPRSTSPKIAPAPAPTRELVGEARTPLLLDAPRAMAWNRAQLSGRPIPPTDDFSLPPLARMRVDLEVLVDGRPVPTVSYAGKTYLPVRRLGTEYEIRVWNHGPRRIAAIVSVDGLSVISGKPASESQPGYLVTPSSHVLIKGWRRSLEAVAAFRFVERERSYAALMGRPENVGVIGLVAVEEQVWRPRPALERKDTAGPAAGRALGEVGRAGTEYGREIDSRAYYVPFVRSANKRSVTIYYDTVEALREVGVPVDRPTPVPFPGDTDFAPPPPGYKRR
jgi:hypothetical protein